MGTMRRSAGRHDRFVRAVATVVAYLTAVAPLLAEEPVKRPAGPPTGLARPGPGLVYLEGGTGGHAEIGIRFDVARDTPTRATERGSLIDTHLWRRLNAGADRTRPPKMPVTAFGVMQPGSSSLRAGTLTVITQPAGATVYVDDRLAGRSPVDVPNLSRGEHEVRMVRDGYVTQTRDVRLGSEGETLRVTLPPTAPRSERVFPNRAGSSAGRRAIGIALLTGLVLLAICPPREEGGGRKCPWSQ